VRLAPVFTTLLLAGLIAGVQPALAQTSPAPSASPATAAGTTAPEDPAVTSAAQSLLKQVVDQDVDRSKLSSDLNQALTDALIATLSGQLKPLGTATWSYLGRIASPKGSVSVYKLTYSAVSIYVTYGSSEGKVYDFTLTMQSPLGT
jgi:hypothetical protein